MHQYAYHGKGKTIHSSTQIEHYGNVVDDRSAKVPGGQQCIKTLDGYVLPLQIRAGLVYLDMHPPSDQELASLPYVVLTSDVDWDPSTLDHELDLDTWSSQFPHTKDPCAEHRFDNYGDYLHRHVNEASMHPVLGYSLAGRPANRFRLKEAEQFVDHLSQQG